MLPTGQKRCVHRAVGKFKLSSNEAMAAIIPVSWQDIQARVRPFSSESWPRATFKPLGLESPYRFRDRPKKTLSGIKHEQLRRIPFFTDRQLLGYGCGVGLQETATAAPERANRDTGRGVAARRRRPLQPCAHHARVDRLATAQVAFAHVAQDHPAAALRALLFVRHRASPH